MDKSAGDGQDAECERCCWDEPSGTNGLAGDIARDLKDDVGDVESGEDDVVVVGEGIHVQVGF